MIESQRGINNKLDKIIEILLQFPVNVHVYPKFLNNIPRFTDAFIGRDDELMKLNNAFTDSEKIVLIHGLGGIGKSSLAKQYAHLHQKEYKHLAWVEVKITETATETATETSTVGLPEAFIYDPLLIKNINVVFEDKEELAQKFVRVMNVLSNIEGKNLLIIDNVGNDLVKKVIQENLPSGNWHILVTSRMQTHGFKILPLDTLSPAEAKKLVTTHYKIETDYSNIDELLREVGYHTLTIELLAKTLESLGGWLKVKDLLERLKNKQLSDPVIQEKIRTAHSPEETEIFMHLMQAFQLANLSIYEKWLMKQFTFLVPEKYATGTLKEWLQIDKENKDEKTFFKSLRSLAQKGWLKTDNFSAYEMHRLIQQITHYQLQPKLDDVKTLVTNFMAKLHFDTSTDFTLMFRYIPYVEFISNCFNETDKASETAAALQSNLGIVVMQFGDYLKARDLLEKALKSDLANFGEKHPKVAVRRSNLSSVYSDLGDFKKARELLEKALESDLENFGEKHPKVAVRQSNLGNVYQNLGDFEKARDLLEKALESDLANFDEKHPNVAIRQSNLAIVYKDLGDFEKARDLLEKALESDLANFGEKHPIVAVRQSNLASVHKDLGDFEKARDLLEKALESNLANFGEKHFKCGV